MKETIYASGLTCVLGWWSIAGFFWTLGSLFTNANGGDQSEENNAALLRIVAFQLYRQGRYREAYEAMLASYSFKPDKKSEKDLEFLKKLAGEHKKTSLRERFWSLDLYPGIYHLTLGATAALTIYFIGTENTMSASALLHQESALKDPGPKMESASTHFNQPEEAMPSNNDLLFIAAPQANSATPVIEPKAPMAPLKIATLASDGNYVVKVEDWNTRTVVFYAFIRAGSTAEFELPLGSYRLKFACGTKWYGLDHLFGPDTSYSYVPSKLDFTLEGDRIRGHRIELIPQIGGNLQTPKMKVRDW